MGTQVTANAAYDSKGQLVIATVAAGSVAISAGDMIAFFGTTGAGRNADLVRGLRQCLDALREVQFPVASAENWAKLDILLGGKGNIIVAAAAGITAIVEDDVVIGYSNTHASEGASEIFEATGEKLIRKVQEILYTT